jgi:hypothetical protein
MVQANKKRFNYSVWIPYLYHANISQKNMQQKRTTRETAKNLRIFGFFWVFPQKKPAEMLCFWDYLPNLTFQVQVSQVSAASPRVPWLQLAHPALRVAPCAWALQPGPAAAGEAVTAEGGAAEEARRRPGRWNPGFPSV